MDFIFINIVIIYFKLWLREIILKLLTMNIIIEINDRYRGLIIAEKSNNSRKRILNLWNILYIRHA